MKGRNPLVIILVVLLVLGLIAAFFLGSSSDIETTGMGAEDVQKPVSSTIENVDGDRLPQEFKRLVVDLGDMQQTLESMNNKIEALEAENATLKQEGEIKKEVEVASKNQVKNTSENDYLDKPDESLFPLPNLDTELKRALDGDIGKFIAPIGVAAKDLKNSVMPLKNSEN